MKYLILLLAILVLVPFSSVFADPSVTLDKSSYVYGDTIRVSGTVQYESETFVFVRMLSSSDMLAIGHILPNQSGSFSVTFKAEGPKWQQSGTYTVSVSYQGQTTEKTFQFTKPAETPQTVPQLPAQPPAQTPGQTPTQDPASETSGQQEPVTKPRITIRGFPDISLPPQHYIDRYNNEGEFREWFDSIFPGYTIHDIVGYRQTHVTGYPDPQYSPQHYIERYNNEVEFREWFDAVFPHSTIYETLGVSEDVKILVPSWVKQYARWWSSGDINDAQFATRIGDLIRQKVITIEGEITITASQNKAIPNWFKNNAMWYSESRITDDDFLFGIQYLIEHEIIIV